MGKALIAVISLVVGVVLGAVFGGALIGGGAVGAGIATGLSAGICSTVQAAQEEGIMTPEEVDQVLARATADMASLSGVETSEPIVGSAAQCDTVLENLRNAAS